MDIEFTLNDNHFIVTDMNDGSGYFWISGEAEGRVFPTAIEAQQDAIDNHSEYLEGLIDAKEQADNDREYGSYEDQVESLWRSTRI